MLYLYDVECQLLISIHWFICSTIFYLWFTNKNIDIFFDSVKPGCSTSLNTAMPYQTQLIVILPSILYYYRVKFHTYPPRILNTTFHSEPRPNFISDTIFFIHHIVVFRSIRIQFCRTLASLSLSLSHTHTHTTQSG